VPQSRPNPPKERTIAVIHRTDPQHLRSLLILLTVALAIATALAVYFAATRTSAVTGDTDRVSSETNVEQDSGQLVDAPCWRPNLPC